MNWSIDALLASLILTIAICYYISILSNLVVQEVDTSSENVLGYLLNNGLLYYFRTNRIDKLEALINSALLPNDKYFLAIIYNGKVVLELGNFNATRDVSSINIPLYNNTFLTIVFKVTRA